MATKYYLSLDVGTKRTGIAMADSDVRLAYPVETVTMDEGAIEKIIALAGEKNVHRIIVGYPRNLSGEPTAQTKLVEDFATKLAARTTCPLLFQDESLTSVEAEKRLLSQPSKQLKYGAVDAEAACIILQDYLEQSHE